MKPNKPFGYDVVENQGGCEVHFGPFPSRRTARVWAKNYSIMWSEFEVTIRIVPCTNF